MFENSVTSWGPGSTSPPFTGEPTIVERHGEPRTVLVSYTWWAERHDQAGQGTHFGSARGTS
ncbi:hypothetical protein ACFQVD_27430 [Streptosporangium amethystogenes subsp. fukuiense]|uniref:Uncharacterized protein n=1 Tax=Streptosporangium amethystogenes subsp. fukuiense TaxID=698418 RepID=A0ABW2T5U8_9ACTN